MSRYLQNKKLGIPDTEQEKTRELFLTYILLLCIILDYELIYYMMLMLYCRMQMLINKICTNVEALT